MEREELDQLMKLLREEIAANRIKIRSQQTLADLAKVRLAPDGKVDPATVTSSVRAMALALAASRADREMRKVSLAEAQAEYFEILDRFFGGPFAEMKRHGLNPQIVAGDMVSRDRIVKAFVDDMEEFAEGMREFWEFYGPIVELHLREMRSMKAIFGGDIFPSYVSNIACSVGLYTDTIVLPDPLQRVLQFRGITNKKEVVRLTVKHALNALSYRELALAELDVPIIVMSPDFLAEEGYHAALSFAAGRDALEHFSKMFGRRFDSAEEVNQYLTGFKSPAELVGALADPDRLLFDTEWTEPLGEQFAKHFEEVQGKFDVGKQDLPQVTARMILGRLMQSNDTTFRAARFGGTPLIDAETSWRYLGWKYEYNGNLPPRPSHNKELVLNKALSVEGSGAGMLSGVPPEMLIELRKQGALSEVRELLQKGISEIDTASDGAVEEVTKKVIENLDTAFEAHDRQLRNISTSKAKFYGLDVSRYIVGGGVTVLASLVHSVPLAVIAAGASMVGIPSPFELRQKFQEISALEDSLRRSPCGIMFRHMKGTFGF